MREIKFPLGESEKQLFRYRLEEVLSQKDGEQVIILWDKNRITDYYQNVCTSHLVEKITDSAKDYARITHNRLIKDNL